MTIESVNQLWPIIAWLFAGTVAVVWGAATLFQRVGTLEKKAEDHNDHGEEIARLNSSIEHLTGRVGQLVDEIRNERSRGGRLGR